MPTFLHHALLACGFLTRLVPARVATADDMAAAVRWFPLAGLVVGGACWLPFALGLAASHPAIQAWLYVLINLWVTRGLHWDGVADLADAWGSSATGERFWDILKDSRIGAFGVMGLLLGFGGQYIGAHEIFISGRLGVLIAAPIVGRGACVILAALVPPRQPLDTWKADLCRCRQDSHRCSRDMRNARVTADDTRHHDRDDHRHMRCHRHGAGAPCAPRGRHQR